ncbi:glutathione synthase/RimK-type ligase-like ATP-grasp enzyme [Parabacteroides sp. PF5-5]|uniref:STM4014 family protein n=1 Tax=unclassified Parabacteroides TaxID=2649774 RepID=UPI0024766B43|nr:MULTISPECIES: STM4014 family protein [unclassified Parabacteroides]MDH6307044.1 glutathione synthase/RimK-type ligase-like ATP-grasp enzyme [Parabacteroides sp. PH5-39]MDH6317959.1 glutathione synthase/RimK-type ligase-like ATP-grasp enzyme [Parabacteroides sp. PF5-13]MDH6321688.1 glutathione synthase/RimK-type ligase-like ATP-grasp enzyme [Parabacteroides sp. PH5-13]MDH6325439.1 glutathione synthase/RimK-type ligase-like ATP-grasp enzyme [Parabacteroides sp. PH5-8]MDH6329150.1 glutathione 
MQALVVSNIESRRTEYFIKAGKEIGIDTRFATYQELEKGLSAYQHLLIKLEPPVYSVSDFSIYQKLCDEYIRLLERLGEIKKAPSTLFLNEPGRLICSLDKAESKSVLTGLAVTPLVSSTISCFDELMELPDKQKRKGLFIKPRYGSGAGGIMALKQHPKTGELAVYTTLLQSGEDFLNTKQIHHLKCKEKIARYADMVLGAGVIVEEWLPKDEYKGEKYDLRVVCQFGKVEHIVVRYSKAPITNLHLNNKAGNFEELATNKTFYNEVEALCLEALKRSGLHYAGIDVLIERDSQKPYIIEINGQGDHIYQDMYKENNIYKEQLLTIHRHEDRHAGSCRKAGYPDALSGYAPV